MLLAVFQQVGSLSPRQLVRAPHKEEITLNLNRVDLSHFRLVLALGLHCFMVVTRLVCAWFSTSFMTHFRVVLFKLLIYWYPLFFRWPGGVLLVSVQGVTVNVDPVFCTWLLYQPRRGSSRQQQQVPVCLSLVSLPPCSLVWTFQHFVVQVWHS